MIDLCRIEAGNLEAFRPILTTEAIEQLSYGDSTIAIGTYDTEAGNAVTGALVGEIVPDGFDLNYMYVVTDYRRQGVGTYMMDYLADLCLYSELHSIMVEYPTELVGEDVRAFLDALGFDEANMTECDFDIKIGDAKKLKMFADLSEGGLSTSVVKMSETPRRLLNSLAGELYTTGVTTLYDLLHSGEINEELSFVYLDGEEIRSLMICSDCEDGVFVEFVYSDPRYSTLLLPTMKKLAAGLAAKLSDDAVMHIIGMTDNAVSLLEGIFKDQITVKDNWIMRTLAI